MISYFCECNSESKFNKTYMVAIKTEKGRKSVDGKVYKEFISRALVCIEENFTEERISEIFQEDLYL